MFRIYIDNGEKSCVCPGKYIVTQVASIGVSTQRQGRWIGVHPQVPRAHLSHLGEQNDSGVTLSGSSSATAVGPAPRTCWTLPGGEIHWCQSLSSLPHRSLDVPECVYYKLSVTVHRCLQKKAPKVDFCTPAFRKSPAVVNYTLS